MKKSRNNKKIKILKISNREIEAIERDYWDRYNSGMPKWQQDMY
tara:strand:+ start:649 stop:780 length:132 start_codon:yes stop_codon:yes gene_type:complete